MSTYLVAILVSDYDCRDDTAITPLSLKVNVSVCARPNKYDELDRALNASLYFVGFFETLFDNKYPLPKLGKHFFPTNYYFYYLCFKFLSCRLLKIKTTLAFPISSMAPWKIGVWHCTRRQTF